MARILIIEDTVDLAELMAITLRTAGHEVEVAGDGACALRAVRHNQPDLVVVDIMLPDIVGLSLCESLRQDRTDDEPRLPILVVSACSEDDTRPISLAAGADDFLPKPFSPYQLLVRVHALLGHPAPEQSSARAAG